MAQSRRVPVRSGKTRRRGPALPSWALGAAVGAFLLATGGSAYMIFTAVRDVVAGWTVTGAPVNPVDPIITSDGTPSGATPHLSNTPQPWNGKDRITILMMGTDRRPGEDDAPRSDSLILMTLDPTTLNAGILSIPRDLWVDIPGFGHAKINTAYYNGEHYRVPGGGPGLAVSTVQNLLGVPIHHYVAINFHAFETFIDEVGGIEVDNPADINDPLYPDCCYGYDPFYLRAGRQHLNGHDALRYARTRHDSDDIARAKRQQQVIMAVRQKVLSLNMLPTLIAKAPVLSATLQEGVTTDLSLDQIASLALLAQQVPDQAIKSFVIDYNYMEPATSPDGLDILRPYPSKIRELRDELFSTSGVLAPVVQEGDLASLAKQEGARIVVQNGTYTDGLAGATADHLRSLGLDVVDAQTAPDRGDYGYASSVIKDYTGRPYTTRYLAQVMGVSQGGILSGNDLGSPVDVIVVVGNDWVIPGNP